MLIRTTFFGSVVMLVVAVAMLCITGFASADVHVQGYLKHDGTYVESHWRSNPDGNPNNNWSTKGNWNPHTGQPGYKNVIDYNRYDYIRYNTNR